MLCRKCRKPIPYHASKCNHCYRKSGHRLATYSKLVNDMFDSTVYSVMVDKDKNAARYRYIHNLKEYKYLSELEAKRRKKKFGILKLFSILFYLFIAIAIIFSFYLMIQAKTSGNEDMLNISPLIFGGFVMLIPVHIVIVTIIKNIVEKIKENKFRAIERQIIIHNCKKAYYANANVFGYIVFDHTERVTDSNDNVKYIDYYGYYEVDKQNIVSIGYDQYFAEYILYLREPIYINYSMEPTKEFRIQDVFDDSVLSNALTCDLPPKNIPF